MIFLAKIKSAACAVDQYFCKIYERIASAYFGRLFFRFIREVVLAILIAFSTYLGTTISHAVQTKDLEIQKLNQVYVSMSSDSVDSMFGVPYIKKKRAALIPIICWIMQC